MPNHQPYQNPPSGTSARPQTQSPQTSAQPQGASTPAQPQGASTPQPSQTQTFGQQQNAGQQRPQESSQSLADRAGKAVDQVKTSAIERVGDVRSRAEAGIADQRGKIVERVQRVGDVLLGASQQMRHEDDFVAQALEYASKRVERAATYVSAMDAGRLAGDAQRFARTHPAWFIGGAFVAGLALGRFLKSSPPGGGMSGGMSRGMDAGAALPDWDAEERW